MLREVQAATAGLGDSRVETFFAWQATIARWAKFILDWYAYEGWEQAPLQRIAFERRLVPRLVPRNPAAHVALLEALMTDAGGATRAHIAYRRKHEGNTVLGFTGMAGTGKTSGALGVMDHHDPRGGLPPDLLRNHVVFDAVDVTERLPALKRGEWLLIDEDITPTGEGARTTQIVLDLVVDTFRQSGLNLIQAGPRLEPDPRFHALYESAFWHPGKKRTLFLVWVEGQLVGVDALDWVRAPVWESYRPFKRANVERSLHGQFRSNEAVMRRGMRAFENPRFVDFLLSCANKPKKKDVETAYELIEPLVVATRQFDRIVHVVYIALCNYDRLRNTFEVIFGVVATSGFVKVAQKCYEE